MPGRRIIGVDVGGSKLLAGAVDTDFFVHRRVQRSVAGLDQASLIDAITQSVNETREASGGVVEAVGFGIPSPVDTRSSGSSVAAHVPLRDVLAERTGLPVVVDNDGNLAALAEHRAGAAQGADHALMLTVGAGIGGGLIINGELYRGATGVAGELGHITIDLDEGSLESLASGTALVREATELARRRPNSALARAQSLARGQSLDEALVTELAHDGDAAAREAIALIGKRLGVGIASLINALNPQVVVIGGTVVGAGELLLGPARAEVARRALEPARAAVSIVGAHFGIEAGMIGAAVLARDSLTSGRAR